MPAMWRAVQFQRPLGQSVDAEVSALLVPVAPASGCGAAFTGRGPWRGSTSIGGPSNKWMKLSIALASAPRDTEEGHSACSPFGEHRALGAYPRCSTDVKGLKRRTEVVCDLETTGSVV